MYVYVYLSLNMSIGLYEYKDKGVVLQRKHKNVLLFWGSIGLKWYNVKYIYNRNIW